MHRGTQTSLAFELGRALLDHRARGRRALVEGDLEVAFGELWAARDRELDLLEITTDLAAVLPPDAELETDLVPLARLLSSHTHPRACVVWRRVLEDRPARSIQLEAAEWLAREAFGDGQVRAGLRILHAMGELGQAPDAERLRTAYRHARLDPDAAFALYLAAARLPRLAARAVGLRDPLTEHLWADQDPRWWWYEDTPPPRWAIHPYDDARAPDHQAIALARAGDLVTGERDRGWLMLAQGDVLAGPTGPRLLGRTVRSGRASQDDEDLFVRIRLAYEGAADRLPDMAWPAYRLAELLAAAGFQERANEYLARADQHSTGEPAYGKRYREVLRRLVDAAAGGSVPSGPSLPRVFPSAPHPPRPGWRSRLFPGLA